MAEENNIVSIEDRRRVAADFENVWRKARLEGFPTFKDSYQYVYMQGRAAGFAAAMNQIQKKEQAG